MPADCHPGGAPHTKLPNPRHVSFAEEITMLGDMSPSVCSPEQGTPTQLVPAGTEDVIAPVGEPIGSSSTAPASLLPLRDSRRSLGRSTMGKCTSNCRVFPLTWIVPQTFLLASSVSNRRCHRLLLCVLTFRTQSVRRKWNCRCLLWWTFVLTCQRMWVAQCRHYLFRREPIFTRHAVGAGGSSTSGSG